MSIIIVHGTIEIEQGHMEEALELSVEHVRRSRKEAGCLNHNVHIDVENRNRLVFYEQWQNMDALRAHFSVPESGEFVSKIGKFATAEPFMSVFESTQIK